MKIIYCIDNKLGGITSFNYNIINNNPVTDTLQWVIHIDQKESSYTRSDKSFHADKEFHFHFSARENLYEVIRRLHAMIPEDKGVLVLNDSLEMQMLDHYPVQQTTYQVVHDEYNFTLAERYHHVTDVLIAHSRFFYDKLLAALPQRKETIFYLPHGVPVPELYRAPDTGNRPIRLLFLGRMSSRKGIFDLPQISQWLRSWNVAHSWTFIGNGPELEAFREKWTADDTISFHSPASNKEVIELCARHDVFVLPTQFEGSPVSLLETMSTGLVPVITDLPGGIREIVTEDIGFRLPQGDTEGFADAIRRLSADRPLLNALSLNCRKKTEQQFDVRVTAGRYHELFAKHAGYYRPKQLKKIKIGSRLDQPWLPGVITRAARSF